LSQLQNSKIRLNYTQKVLKIDEESAIFHL